MKKSLAYTVLFWLLVADLATAGDYELILGKGVELCEVCLENLRRQSVEEAICDRQYSAELGLKTIEWKKLDILDERDNLQLLKRVMMFVTPPFTKGGPTYYDDERLFEQQVRGESENDELTLAMVQVDFDNDGNPEPVVKYRRHRCISQHSSHGSKQFLVILTNDEQNIDPAKTDQLMQNPSKEAIHPHGLVIKQMYDAFRYKGYTYIDKWDTYDRPWTYYVYQTAHGTTNRICKFRYADR